MVQNKYTKKNDQHKGVYPSIRWIRCVALSKNGLLKNISRQGEGRLRKKRCFFWRGTRKKRATLKKTHRLLSFNSFTRSYSEKVRYKFQEQEHDEETGWIAFKWRNHDPAIGRFFNVDPLAEKYYYNSPYAFSENKVVVHRELEGLESQYLFNKEVMKTTDYVGQKIDQAGK
ncbi:MAG: hypothetical protein GY816_02810, partial [Cytophagales bacterium]|nr:hypothetical protein [Cytophagales bacterium]